MLKKLIQLFTGNIIPLKKQKQALLLAEMQEKIENGQRQLIMYRKIKEAYDRGQQEGRLSMINNMKIRILN